ncbi:DBF4-type zinc finger-containing protein 2 isoform X1 [Labrus bergylta]|uniref:DBF4-type zinc finger-containing protein 2 isoform X1 n=2 Tax=Labrus bergylta TaxID=56723 RepID=UPI0009B3AB6D|nr:DBF4-type zinc finger-containing protein 2 isoform X1 [Labrus bergylta]XP_020513771.1 DBF4-type zinc finger-containing protein 2 isoform X1 [Labrus bergylta]XP_029138052.1 DBF4-type zinc finger-containing protein 2 isoform X1 [Labrus bergylta]
MSHSSDKGDQRNAESAGRTWEEPQPGPSRCQPSRQGYCGYCRVLYSNLDQHLSSLRHLDSVRTSSRGSSMVSSASKTKLTLLERFLQDVLQHHPNRYNDSRPSHADLPSVSAPPLPREELDELCFSEKDSRSLGTRDHLPSSDSTSYKPANQQEESCFHSQPDEGVTEEAGQERLSAPIREQEQEGTKLEGKSPSTNTQTLPPLTQAPPPVHRKAHRKTNRRKTSPSSPSSSPCRVSAPGSPPPLKSGTSLCPVLALPSKSRPSLCLGLGTGPGPPSETRPWLSWQKERREAHKEEAFSSETSDPLEQTIEEVIQMYCYDISSTPCQREETESFHFSIPVSTDTTTDDWDPPLQSKICSQRGPTLSYAHPSYTPVQVSQTEGQDLSRLMDVQVQLDQVYTYQLESVLGMARQDQGFWTLPIDEILPAPQHIPESFRGKTWAQVEQEDMDKVEQLVRQFRGEKFLCYFDSESLARYGRRCLKKKGCVEAKEAVPNNNVLPLLDHEEGDSADNRRRRRRSFRVASRCQVVKVSHGTQTVRLVFPAVRQSASDAPPISKSDYPANQDAAEKTPEAQMWRCLPPAYSNIITPLQARTSVVYLLSSPSGPTHMDTSTPDAASKRCRKKRRPLDLQGLKVKYKQLPVRFYDPNSNRILKNPPKGFLWNRGSSPSSLPPTCVRQLFRSLSPDINTGLDTPLSLLSTLSQDSEHTKDAVRRRGRTPQALPPPSYNRSEQGRGVRRDRTHPHNPKRRTRTRATPPQPRREGLRRAGPHQPPPARQGRSRRGRGLERSRR